MEAFLKKKSHAKAAFVKTIKNIKESQVMTHKSRIWRDIDKHPLPSQKNIEVKLECGSILKKCYSGLDGSVVYFRDSYIDSSEITQWRDAK